MLPFILGGLILLCLLTAIVTDLANRIIPNRLVVIIFFSSVGLRLASRPTGLPESLLIAVAVLAALGLLASHDIVGWGDVKLIAALTVAVPADRVIPMLLAITLAGGLVSCLYLVARFVLRRAPAVGRFASRESTRILANEPMPYALAVFGGFAYGLVAQ